MFKLLLLGFYGILVDKFLGEAQICSMKNVEIDIFRERFANGICYGQKDCT